MTDHADWKYRTVPIVIPREDLEPEWFQIRSHFYRRPRRNGQGYTKCQVQLLKKLANLSNVSLPTPLRGGS